METLHRHKVRNEDLEDIEMELFQTEEDKL